MNSSATNRRNQFSLKFLFFLLLFAAIFVVVISFVVASRQRMIKNSKVRRSEYMTMAMLRVFEKAHREHLSSGGKPIVELHKMGGLRKYIKSQNWLTNQNESPVAVQFLSNKKDLSTDAFGNSILIRSSQDGVFEFVSVGFDGKIGTEDDIAIDYHFEVSR